MRLNVNEWKVSHETRVLKRLQFKLPVVYRLYRYIVPYAIQTMDLEIDIFWQHGFYEN